MFVRSSFTNMQASKDQSDLHDEKVREINSLLSAFPGMSENVDTKSAPESALGSALNGMMAQWNSLLSQVITEVHHPQPILEHIKETAEFSVKQFRDACLEMNSELTRISMDWQLKYPSEMSKQEVSEYENSIRRQETLLSKMQKKLDEEISSGEHLN